MKTTLLRGLRLAAPVLFAAVVHACAGGGTEPVQEPPANLSAVLVGASDQQIFGDGVLPMSFASTFLGTFSESGCSYEPTSRGYVCPRFSSGGLTIDRSFTLYDAAGNTQSEFGRTTTASVRMKSHLAGTITGTGTALSLDAVDDRTVSGLLTSRHVLNGTSTSTMNGTIGTSTSMDEVHMTTASAIENLLLPSRNNRWPGPGTITMEESGRFAGFDTHSTVRMTFNGTKCVSLAISSGSLTQTFVIDLSNPESSGCRP